MGTNYYLKAAPKCPHCNRGPERGLHIGKSTDGLMFGLHIPLEAECAEHNIMPPIKELIDWIPWFIKFGIVDEEGNDVGCTQLLDEITNRPASSKRHNVDQTFCIGPGKGTYDLLIGWFR